MDSLPNELILVIFDNILKITDKRQFLKTCILYNNLTKKSILIAEDNNAIICFNKTTFIDCTNIKYYKKQYELYMKNCIKKYRVEKFALELCCDEYFELLPITYLNNNQIIMKLLSCYNKIDLLQKCVDNGCNIDPIICDYGALVGHLDVVIWGKNKGNKLNLSTCLCAAQFGNLEILKWLVEQNSIEKFEEPSIYDNRICQWAAKGGHLQIITWARENGFDWDSSAPAESARFGRLDDIKWMRENGCPWDATVCSNAAFGGQLEILKYLRKQNCEWDANTCSNAALNGHLDILIWARENDCEWNSNVCKYAKENGHLDILEWARVNSCPE